MVLQQSPVNVKMEVDFSMKEFTMLESEEKKIIAESKRLNGETS
jgi:hypothetical protein